LYDHRRGRPPDYNGGMNGYNLALTLHLFGILALFGGETLILTALGGARRARSVQGVREWTRMGVRLARITPVFALLAFIPAAYMVSDRAGWKSHWVSIALSSLVLLVVLLLFPLLPRLSGLAQQADETPDGDTPAHLQRAAHDPLLWLVTQVATTIYSGIVVLMVFKPDTGPSLLIMGAAVLLGVLATVPAYLRYQSLSG
jgi:hypothetical protein